MPEWRRRRRRSHYGRGFENTSLSVVMIADASCEKFSSDKFRLLVLLVNGHACCQRAEAVLQSLRATKSSVHGGQPSGRV